MQKYWRDRFKSGSGAALPFPRSLAEPDGTNSEAKKEVRKETSKKSRTPPSLGPLPEPCDGKPSDNKVKKDSVTTDLDRVLHLAGELRSNGTHAKAVFACAHHGIWLEYDLPPHLQATQLFVDRHFHLRPIAHLLGAYPRVGVVLVDRHKARIFDLRLRDLTEREGLFQPLSRKGRSDGFADTHARPCPAPGGR